MFRRVVSGSPGGLTLSCVVVFFLLGIGELDASLLVTNGTHIIDYDPSTNLETVLPVSESAGIVALAVDVDGQYVFYTNADTGEIVRCGLDGSDQQTLVQADVTQPTGLAYDWVSGLVYWTDEGWGTVEVARADGTNRKTIISGQLLPRGIAVDPVSGYVYWGNQGDHTIRRARLDGSESEVLHDTGLFWPNELVVDFEDSRLYWIDGYYRYIGSSELDGTDRTVVANVSSGSVLFGLALEGDTLYYTSWEDGNVFSVDKNSGLQEEVGLEGQGETLYGLVAVDSSRQPAGTSACQSDNGGCSHLCLPSGPDTRVCACPNDGGLAIGADGKTCADVPCLQPGLDGLIHYAWIVLALTTPTVLVIGGFLVKMMCKRYNEKDKVVPFKGKVKVIDVTTVKSNEHCAPEIVAMGNKKKSDGQRILFNSWSGENPKNWTPA